jgi:transposase
LCDRLGNPLNAVLSPGQAADNFYLAPVLDGFEIPVRHGRRNRPKEVVADKAYNGNRVRHYLKNRGIRAMIPEKSLPKGHQRRKKGPHYRFNKSTYKERNVVERLINHLKEMRRFATRFEKLAANFLAMVKLAFIKLLLNKCFSDTL